MRNGQNNNNKRMRGRNHGGGGGNNNNNRKNHNPLTRVYESNGPDLKIRGTAQHVAEKYVQLARDSHTSGDPVSAENYYQHAEHYFRLIAAAQEQFRQQNPYYRPETENRNEDNFDGDDDGNGQPMPGDQYAGQHQGGQQHSGPQHGGQQQSYQQRNSQSYQQREQQSYPQRDQQQPRQHQPREQYSQPANEANGNAEHLPSFITGGQSGQNYQSQPAQNQAGNASPNPAANQQDANGAGNGPEGQGDRFPLHRRRRRHRGPRPDMQDGQPAMNSGSDDQPSGE